MQSYSNSRLVGFRRFTPPLPLIPSLIGYPVQTNMCGQSPLFMRWIPDRSRERSRLINFPLTFPYVPSKRTKSEHKLWS